MNQTIKTFSFKRQYEPDLRIKADYFFGSEQLPKLESVTIRYTLENLTRNSFTGLTNIKNLVLSDCRIESIGAGTFDPISETIKYLNLDDNLFTTLPAGLFNLMLPLNIVTISFFVQ